MSKCLICISSKTYNGRISNYYNVYKSFTWYADGGCLSNVQHNTSRDPMSPIFQDFTIRYTFRNGDTFTFTRNYAMRRREDLDTCAIPGILCIRATGAIHPNCTFAQCENIRQDIRLARLKTHLAAWVQERRMHWYAPDHVWKCGTSYAQRMRALQTAT
jgi:hypothetical protein